MAEQGTGCGLNKEPVVGEGSACKTKQKVWVINIIKYFGACTNERKTIIVIISCNNGLESICEKFPVTKLYGQR